MESGVKIPHHTTIFTGKISTAEMFLKKPERSRADPVKIY